MTRAEQGSTGRKIREGLHRQEPEDRDEGNRSDAGRTTPPPRLRNRIDEKVSEEEEERRETHRVRGRGDGLTELDTEHLVSRARIGEGPPDLDEMVEEERQAQTAGDDGGPPRARTLGRRAPHAEENEREHHEGWDADPGDRREGPTEGPLGAEDEALATPEGGEQEAHVDAEQERERERTPLAKTAAGRDHDDGSRALGGGEMDLGRGIELAHAESRTALLP